MNNRNAFRVEKRARDAWDDAIYRLQKMSQATTVRPKSGAQLVILDQNGPPDVVNLNIGPVVFNIQERPDRHRLNLYVVVEGWLSFEWSNFKTLPFQTRNFGTKVAYFRSKPNQLEHIFGAHYDMDEKDFRHPVFHAQLTSQMAFRSYIQNHSQQNCQIVDHMNGIIRTVRIPTAQMDVFSVLMQLCADHLIGRNPGQEVTKAFQEMRTACSFFVGAAHKMNFLNTAPAASCYRSTHWYNY